MQVSAKGSDREELAYAGFIVSYSPEYLRFRANPIVLRDVAEQTGGREIDVSLEPEQLTAQIYGNREPKTSKARIFDWFLMVLACMIPMDVAVRRVQVDFSWLRTLFRREEQKESGATMGALLEKSQAVRTAMETTQKETVSRPAATQPKRRVVLPTKPAESKAQEPEPRTTDAEPPSEPDGSTTSRLLQMKRKREEEKEE